MCLRLPDGNYTFELEVNAAALSDTKVPHAVMDACQRAINITWSPLGLKAPYGVMPGSFPGGINSEFDE